MASHRLQPPLALTPRRSRRFAAFVVVTHLLAGFSVIGLPGPWRLLLPLVAVSLIYQVYVRVLGLAPWSIRTATWHPDGTWSIVLRSGTETPARLSPSTFVSVSLVVLNLRRGRWRHWSLPLFADALDGEELRRLRQRLRIEGARRQPDSGP